MTSPSAAAAVETAAVMTTTAAKTAAAAAAATPKEVSHPSSSRSAFHPLLGTFLTSFPLPQIPTDFDIFDEPDANPAPPAPVVTAELFNAASEWLKLELNTAITSVELATVITEIQRAAEAAQGDITEFASAFATSLKVRLLPLWISELDPGMLPVQRALVSISPLSADSAWKAIIKLAPFELPRDLPNARGLTLLANAIENGTLTAEQEAAYLSNSFLGPMSTHSTIRLIRDVAAKKGKNSKKYLLRKSEGDLEDKCTHLVFRKALNLDLKRKRGGGGGGGGGGGEEEEEENDDNIAQRRAQKMQKTVSGLLARLGAADAQTVANIVWRDSSSPKKFGSRTGLCQKRLVVNFYYQRSCS